MDFSDQKTADNSNELSKMKSIEVASDLLMKQISFSKHFLKMIGINIDDKNDIDIERKQLLKNEGKPYEEKLDCFENSFYRSFGEFEGLKLENFFIKRRNEFNEPNSLCYD